MEKKEVNIIEHKYRVLEADKKSKTNRYYSEQLVDRWCEDERLKDGQGIDIEYAVEDDYNEMITEEFLAEHLSCGVVSKFEKEGKTYYATVRFKRNKFTEKLYSGEIKVEDLAVVPKGLGFELNLKIQDDYELMGFNLVNAANSAFSLEEDSVKKKEKV